MAVRTLCRCLAAALLIVHLAGAGVGYSFAAGIDKASSGRFTGIAFVTDDLKWYERFARPELPEIKGHDQFVAGERGTLGILFSNAEARDGVVKIVCDVTVFDPDKSRLIVDSGPCYEGPYRGPNILHPALLELHFTIGAKDPVGKAGFKITLRDAHSRRSVKLAVDFLQGRGK